MYACKFNFTEECVRAGEIKNEERELGMVAVFLEKYFFCNYWYQFLIQTMVVLK
jgi:hypothetical protein